MEEKVLSKEAEVSNRRGFNAEHAEESGSKWGV